MIPMAYWHWNLISFRELLGFLNNSSCGRHQPDCYRRLDLLVWARACRLWHFIQSGVQWRSDGLCVWVHHQQWRNRHREGLPLQGHGRTVWCQQGIFRFMVFLDLPNISVIFFFLLILCVGFIAEKRQGCYYRQLWRCTSEQWEKSAEGSCEPAHQCCNWGWWQSISALQLGNWH